MAFIDLALMLIIVFFSRAVFDGTYKRKTNWEDNNMPKHYPLIGASGNSLSVYVYFYTLVTVIVTVLMQL